MENEPLFKFIESSPDEKQLTCSVIQAAQMLVLLNAELARILKIHCSDVGDLLTGKQLISTQSPQWQLARRFIVFYNLLFDYTKGDAVIMRNWLRRENTAFDNSPLLKIIDDGLIEEVIACLESSLADCNQSE